MMNIVRNFIREENGEDLIEYGLLAAFVAALGVAIAYTLGLDTAIKAAFQRAIDNLSSVG
jgi:Flp pilus assembly pilin Flp